jgi:hypothetical protein
MGQGIADTVAHISPQLKMFGAILSYFAFGHAEERNLMAVLNQNFNDRRSYGVVETLFVGV